jgi:hypothetical protein
VTPRCSHVTQPAPAGPEPYNYPTEVGEELTWGGGGLGLGAEGDVFQKYDNKILIIFYDRNYLKKNSRPNKNINIKQL